MVRERKAGKGSRSQADGASVGQPGTTAALVASNSRQGALDRGTTRTLTYYKSTTTSAKGKNSR